MIYDKINQRLSSLYQSSLESFGMLVLVVSLEHLSSLVKQLMDEFGFDVLLDVTAIDYPDRKPRFELVYHFYSSINNKRVRIKSEVAEGEMQIPTLTSLYGSAHYLEREVHEMYGLRFDGNDDLRPILLYEGFEGHPLRKDYPIDQEQPLVPYRK